MEGSGETECVQERVKNDDENDSERKINGGSSSNSGVEESSKKSSVRPYVRSKTPRLRWTPDLHLRFLQAVERSGGQERATPKLVLQLMNMKGLNIAHVKSHLQMHRSKKFEEPNYQGMSNHGLFVEGVDRNIYNLSQLPLLPNFNQRYGDVFRNGEARWMDRTGFYERMLSSHYCRSENLDLYTKLATYNERSDPRYKETKCEIGSPHKKETLLNQSNPLGLKSIQLTEQKALEQRISSDYDHEKSNPSSIGPNTRIKRDVTLKRKALDCELGLNLTLGLVSRNHEQQEEESNLSLSLYPTSSSSKFKRMNENFSSENRIRCNTDAALSTSSNRFGLSGVLRDENGEFMACRMQPNAGNPTVKECEALALLKAITWIKEMKLANVIFEFDAKNVVDDIKTSTDDDTEFGSIVRQCKYLLNQRTSLSVQFVYRQANAAAHVLAQAAHLYASLSTYFEMLHCLIEHLVDRCTLYMINGIS